MPGKAAENPVAVSNVSAYTDIKAQLFLLTVRCKCSECTPTIRQSMRRNGSQEACGYIPMIPIVCIINISKRFVDECRHTVRVIAKHIRSIRRKIGFLERMTLHETSISQAEDVRNLQEPKSPKRQIHLQTRSKAQRRTKRDNIRQNISNNSANGTRDSSSRRFLDSCRCSAPKPGIPPRRATAVGMRWVRHGDGSVLGHEKKKAAALRTHHRSKKETRAMTIITDHPATASICSRRLMGILEGTKLKRR